MSNIKDAERTVGIEDAELTVGIKDTEEIRIDQLPQTKNWAFYPLYKSDPNGSLISWQITSNDPLLKETSTPLITARKLYKQKFQEGFRPAGPSSVSIFKGMKAYEYKPKSIKNWPVYTQPKINGIRMLCYYNNELFMRSWLNNRFTHLSHFDNELKEFFQYLPTLATLDGELYCHGMPFSTLTSAVKTVKTIHPLLIEVKYCIFDIVYEDSEGAPFEKRYQLLVNAFCRYVEDNGFPKTFYILECKIATSHEVILQQHDQHVANGYEGIMIKKISINNVEKYYKESLYHFDKCNHILKYKNYKDEEVVIVNINQNTLTVRDARKNVFSLEAKTFLESHKDQQIINKKLTIKYQKLGSDGIPIEPLALTIRDYE